MPLAIFPAAASSVGGRDPSSLGRLVVFGEDVLLAILPPKQRPASSAVRDAPPGGRPLAGGDSSGEAAPGADRSGGDRSGETASGGGRSVRPLLGRSLRGVFSKLFLLLYCFTTSFRENIGIV